MKYKDLNITELKQICKERKIPLMGKKSDLFNRLTRWVQLSDLNFNIIYWSAKDKFIHVLY